MLTMHADQSVIAEALRAGAVGYLVKDCSTDEIAAAIRMAANDEADLSPSLAGAMLDEVRRIDPEPAIEDNETGWSPSARSRCSS
jgi:DNA-binding NarL/FixJ family response regulator